MTEQIEQAERGEMIRLLLDKNPGLQTTTLIDKAKQLLIYIKTGERNV